MTKQSLPLGAALLASAALLLSAPAAALTCQDAALSGLPFCDRRLPVSERVADLLPRLNLTEKIGQTGMVATAVPRWGMQQYNFGGEALHGVWASCVTDNVSASGSGKQLCPTQFPAPVHMSSAWNRDLWRQMADVSSTEARALYHDNLRRHPAAGGFGAPCSRSLEGCLGLSYYTPNVNLVRDPRWGRIEETRECTPPAPPSTSASAASGQSSDCCLTRLPQLARIPLSTEHTRTSSRRAFRRATAT